MTSYTESQVNQLILHKQHLLNESKEQDIVKISKTLCGLQATGTFEPYLYLFSRKNGFVKEELNKHLYETKKLIKIRGMRNTLFIVTQEDAPIIHNATNYLKENRFDGFFKHSDYTREEYNELELKIVQVLQKESLITTEIRKRIKTDRNISIVISLMCDKLLLVRGKPPKGWKDRRNTYSLMKNTYPDLNFKDIQETKAINELVYEYIKSYGPVTEKDISWWGGFTKTNARKAIKFNESRIEEISFSDQVHYLTKTDIELLDNLEPIQTPVINLLANLDPYMMGYKNRGRYIDSKIYDFAFDRSGNATTVILKNGIVIGIWDFQSKPEPIIKVLFFERESKDILQEVFENARKIGEFLLEEEVKVKQCNNPIPLTKRTAGTFMRPLKEC
jgi:hypothetical protein